MIQTHPSSPGTNDQQAALYQRFQANSYINGISSGNSGGMPANQYYNNMNMYPVGRSCTQYFSSSSAASLATSGQMIPMVSPGGSVDPQQQSLQRQRLTYDHPSIRHPQWPPTHYPAQIRRSYEHQFITTPPSYHHPLHHTFPQPFPPPYSQQQARAAHFHHVQQAYVSQKKLLEDTYQGPSLSNQAGVYDNNTNTSNDHYKVESQKIVTPKIEQKPKKQSKTIAKKPRKPPIPSCKSKLIIDTKPTLDHKSGEGEGQSPFQVPNIRQMMLKECQVEQVCLPNLIANGDHQQDCTDSPSAQDQAEGEPIVASMVKKKKMVEEVITNKTIPSPSPPMLYLPTHKPSIKKLRTGIERQTRLVPVVVPRRNKRKSKSNEGAVSPQKVEVKKVPERSVNEELKKQRTPYHLARNYSQTPPESSSEEESSYHVETAVVKLNQKILPKPPAVDLKVDELEDSAIADQIVREEEESRSVIQSIAASSAFPVPMLQIPNPDAFEEDNFSPAVYIPADGPSVMVPPLSPVNAPSEVTTTTPNSVFCSLIEKECTVKLSEEVISQEPETIEQPEEPEEPVREDSDEPVRGESDKPVPPPSDTTSPPVVKKFPIVPPLKKANWLPAPLVSEFSLPLIIEPRTLDHPWQTVGKRKRRKQSISVPSAKTFTPSPEPVRTPSVSSTQGSSSNGKESKRSRRRKKKKKIRAQAKAAEGQESQAMAVAAVEQPPLPAAETTITQRRSNCDFLRECLLRVLPTGWWREKTD